MPKSFMSAAPKSFRSISTPMACPPSKMPWSSSRCAASRALLVEGGPSVAQVFLDADLIDEAIIYQGAKPAGSEAFCPLSARGLIA